VPSVLPPDLWQSAQTFMDASVRLPNLLTGAGQGNCAVHKQESTIAWPISEFQSSAWLKLFSEKTNGAYPALIDIPEVEQILLLSGLPWADIRHILKLVCDCKPQTFVLTRGQFVCAMRLAQGRRGTRSRPKMDLPDVLPQYLLDDIKRIDISAPTQNSAIPNACVPQPESVMPEYARSGKRGVKIEIVSGTDRMTDLANYLRRVDAEMRQIRWPAPRSCSSNESNVSIEEQALARDEITCLRASLCHQKRQIEALASLVQEEVASASSRAARADEEASLVAKVFEELKEKSELSYELEVAEHARENDLLRMEALMFEAEDSARVAEEKVLAMTESDEWARQQDPLIPSGPTEWVRMRGDLDPDKSAQRGEGMSPCSRTTFWPSESGGPSECAPSADQRLFQENTESLFVHTSSPSSSSASDSDDDSRSSTSTESEQSHSPARQSDARTSEVGVSDVTLKAFGAGMERVNARAKSTVVEELYDEIALAAENLQILKDKLVNGDGDPDGTFTFSGKKKREMVASCEAIKKVIVGTLAVFLWKVQKNVSGPQKTDLFRKHQDLKEQFAEVEEQLDSLNRSMLV